MISPASRQMLVGLRERLCGTNALLVQLLAREHQHSRSRKNSRNDLPGFGGCAPAELAAAWANTEARMAAQVAELQGRLDEHVERSERRQQSIETTLQAILAQLEKR